MSITTCIFVALSMVTAPLLADTKILNTHCPLGCPSVLETNTLVIHHIMTLSNNPDTKFADWVAYEVNVTNYETTPGSNFSSDSLLPPDETLEVKDYKGSVYNTCKK